MIGMLMRKLNTAALSRVSRSARPAVIVEPDRETPGMIANICARPISKRIGPYVIDRRADDRACATPCRRPTARRPSRSARRRSTADRETRSRRSFSSASPAIAPGIVAMMRKMTRRSSSVSTRRCTHDAHRRADQRDPFGAEVPEHGDERPEVQRDVEREAWIRPVEQPGREREVRRAADRAGTPTAPE